jgi:hypothetical protein
MGMFPMGRGSLLYPRGDLPLPRGTSNHLSCLHRLQNCGAVHHQYQRSEIVLTQGIRHNHQRNHTAVADHHQQPPLLIHKKSMCITGQEPPTNLVILYNNNNNNNNNNISSHNLYKSNRLFFPPSLCCVKDSMNLSGLFMPYLVLLEQASMYSGAVKFRTSFVSLVVLLYCYFESAFASHCDAYADSK